MQAIILAAGQSTRTYPLTVNKPKPLLEVLDKTLLEHNLDQLTDLVDETILIVGFKKEMIQEHIGDDYKGMKISYAVQEQRLGTGHALMMARPLINDKFLVLNGDDMYSRVDLARMIDNDYAILVKEVEDVRRFGAVIVENEKVKRIVEKPDTQVSKYASVGAYVFDSDIFSIELEKSPRGEFEITDYVTALARMGKMSYEVIKGRWLSVGYPWDYLQVNVSMLRDIEESQIASSATIEDGVVIKGTVVVGENTIIKSGTYIEGPVYIGADCEIGPNAFLRKDTILLDGVRTRAEIIDSVLMKKATAKHACYIGHSVIGEGCNIAAGTITSDYRHDGQNHVTMVKGVKVDSGRRKLGSFFGENVSTGIGTLIYPGRKIWPWKTTLPGQIVDKDIIN